MNMCKDRTLCTGCGACASRCPRGCIAMQTDEWGFLYPKVEEAQCVQCGLCEKICPVGQDAPKTEKKVAYAAYHREEIIREKSSSGGVFTAISREVVRRGGVVFGAALGDDLQVYHTWAENEEGLAAFRGSKYVQSQIGESYRKAEAFLHEGRPVLFSGTPCQIAGLYACLGRPYENLLTQDIICHGVPAPAVWQKYLAKRQTESGGRVKSASFRDKKLGWEQFSMKLSFDNGKVYSRVAARDSFMKSFLGDYCLRPSCYQCPFKTDARLADITLADFWGIGQVLPQMNDGRGTSLVLVHSLRGQALLDSVAAALERTEVDWDSATALNPAIRQSSRPAKNREAFLRAVKETDFDRCVKKYCDPTAWERIKAFGYRVLSLPGKLLRRLRKK